MNQQFGPPVLLDCFQSVGAVDIDVGVPISQWAGC
jgi:hypothetical protein